MADSIRSGWWRWALCGVVGLLFGAVSALIMSGLVGSVRLGGGIDVDGWRADFAIGSRGADPYTRARVARHGLLALAKSEAVYFVRNTDDTGRKLSENCRYRLSGGAFPARWWSITLYDANNLLPMNDDGAYSIDMSDDIVARVGDEVVGEGWRATVSPRAPEKGGLWISSRNAGEFDLTLRLYVPSEALLADPETTLVPPKVERLDCEAGA